MKKTWTTPEVMDIAIAETMYNTVQGVLTDGSYIDNNCEEHVSYES